MSLKTLLKQGLIEWLLEGEPWVVYHTLTDLLDRDTSERNVTLARKAIVEHPFVKRIFNGLNKDGYWRKPKDIHTWWPRKDTTFWILPMLADFSLGGEDNRLARACEYVFST